MAKKKSIISDDVNVSNTNKMINTNKTYISIDNGVSGSIGIITPTSIAFIKTPIFSQISYTKKKKNINRIDTVKIRELLAPHAQNSFLFIERPMVNPGRFAATLSAMRALEATLIVIEELQIPYQYIDSKQWQKELLPSAQGGGKLAKEDTKKASLDVGCRLFPTLKLAFTKHGDADSMLMAEYARRNNY